MATTAEDVLTLVVDAFEPSLALHVTWDSVKLESGATLTPTQVQDVPKAHLTYLDGSAVAGEALYTVILSDPDAPSRADPKFGEWAHWVHINARANDLTSVGEDLTAYVGSAPGKDSGQHRYIVVVYEQRDGAAIHPDEAVIPRASGFPPRRSFKSRAFAAKYGLRPVTAAYYVAEYDDLVPELHKRLQPPAAVA